ncbi:MAG: MetQ/NlpA family ABC transporter substrate-binding protein [Clostridia bacterium]|nr:MetQ/NlpA family ABC transporter substrate-binding protein [Clostridia bacterium]
MKKVCALLLAIVLVLTLAGCAKKDEAPAATEATVATEAPAAEETAATEAPAAEENVATEAPAAEEAVATEAPAAEEAATAEVPATAVKIAVPNDPTNEGRALLLLQAYGLIKLDENAGITATAKDVTENPLGIEFVEAEAAMIPNVLADVDYGIINGNYALAAELPAALLYENAESPYVNVVSVKGGNETTDTAKALAAAVLSQQVADYFANYEGTAISVIENPTDGYDATVDYAALAGTTVKVACTLDPHSYVLNIAKEILAAKDITLDITVVDDYVTPNTMVDAGDVFANFFAHTPYQDNFNLENGTNLVTVAGVHVEPMGLYAGKQADLAALGLN